ncbi:MAG: HAD family hydrolase [Bacteroidales bacterium]|nr:HAD family hydrolase [Bacteroidales bacterium]
MNFEKLQELIERIRSVSIAVVGDFCLDAYWFIDKSGSEISVETGKETKPVREYKYSLGGAGNVANNLTAMGVADVRAFGVIGTDPFGETMKNLMKSAGINTQNILVQENNWSTHVYIKPYSGEEEENRIDFGNFNVLSDDVSDTLLKNLRDTAGSLDLVIINQQVLSGIHSSRFRKGLVEIINTFPEKIFIADSRNYSDDYTGAYRKMNEAEAVRLSGNINDREISVDEGEFREALLSLYRRYGKPVFATRGEKGSVIADQDGLTDIPGLMIIARTDTVGAGDSYLAGVAAALAAGYTLKESAETGTIVAGVTIQKLFQTGTASPEEILKTGKDPDFIYNSCLAENVRHAEYHENTQIEIINRWQKKPEIKHAIFDHDGTVSVLREGWEKIMAPMMVKAILGESINRVPDDIYKKVSDRVSDLIDKTTGIRTLMQMRELISLVREFGFVDESEISDEYGYKEIYNKEILALVNSRMQRTLAGELDKDDFKIKNAGPFLKELRKAGITLYLTSGTDTEDVIREAEFLGYAGLFNGGIYGASHDINNEAKKEVLKKIIALIGPSHMNQVVTFGDGPVEIRETKKAGGLTVGVATDEVRRFGLNEKKRTRLIKAGADIIIPDFTQMNCLLILLNIN